MKAIEIAVEDAATLNLRDKTRKWKLPVVKSFLLVSGGKSSNVAPQRKRKSCLKLDKINNGLNTVQVFYECYPIAFSCAAMRSLPFSQGRLL